MLAALTIALVALTIAAVIAVLLLRRPAAGSEAVLQSGLDGETLVPVGSLFKGGANNSLRAVLALTPTGLRFRIIFEERWAFGELARVDAGPALFGAATLEFKSRSHGTLTARVAGLPIAREVLRALPADVELTPRAAALRVSGEASPP
jgi:hypothetical protein